MIKFKKFDKDDWTGFSGATSFQDGSEPLIGELVFRHETGMGVTAIVIVDRNSISIINENEEEWVYTTGADISQLILTVSKLHPDMNKTDLIDLGFIML